jgi:hypothetical protein
MRHYNILPISVIQNASLTKGGLKRLSWMDWYFSHGENAELTCRHFGISKDTFYPVLVHHLCIILFFYTLMVV